MTDKVFLDTNVLIAFVFFLNSLHGKSNDVLKSYLDFFWSESVKSEFDFKYSEKKKNLFAFLNLMNKYFESPNMEFYNYGDLLNFVFRNFDGEAIKDAKNSINQFWDMYFGIESQISSINLKKAINLCKNDLKINSHNNKAYLINILKLIAIRTKNYPVIDSKLKSEGVHYADRMIILDGHDFACNSFQPVDFVTFDVDCYNGAKNVGRLCFSSIKGKDDFKSS